MRIGSARLTVDLSLRWELGYEELFYDGWHHILRLGFIWIEWYTWNQIFERWRRKESQ